MSSSPASLDRAASLLNETQITREHLLCGKAVSMWDRRRPQRTRISVERKDDYDCVYLHDSRASKRTSSVRAANFEWKCESRARGALNGTAEASLAQRARSLPQVVHFYFNRRARRALIPAMHVTGA
jgi:hypothetical protein